MGTKGFPLVVILLLASGPIGALVEPGGSSPPTSFDETDLLYHQKSRPIDDTWGGDPLGGHIIGNQGQLANEEVLYYVPMAGYDLAFLEGGVMYSFHGAPSSFLSPLDPNYKAQLTGPFTMDSNYTPDETLRTCTVHMDFVGTEGVGPIPGPTLAGTFNFLLGGDEEAWHTSVPACSELIYQDLYDGIDLVYRLEGGFLKYEFIVHPGGGPDRIRVRVSGHQGLHIDGDGTLVIPHPLGDLRDSPPLTFYQDAPSERVESTFILEDLDTYGFKVVHRDPARTLVIDPFVYSTTMGGSWSGVAPSMDIVVDEEGSAYIVGNTRQLDFPFTQGAYQTANAGWADVYVAKIAPDGSTLEYCTYLGGKSYDAGVGCALDDDGCLYIAGHTQSPDFPLSENATRKVMEIEEVFVTKLTPDGGGLIYSTFVGGSGSETGAFIAVDADGHAYITGWTNSTDLPVTEGAYVPVNCTRSTFIAKLDINGSDLMYCTYYKYAEYGWSTWTHGIALDPSGRAYVVGTSKYDDGWFYDEVAFVIRVNADGAGLITLLRLDGDERESGSDIAVDRGRFFYVTGWTSSDDLPVTGSHRVNWSASYSTFVCRFDIINQSMDYLVLIGGAFGSQGTGIAIDGRGCAYFTGSSYSSDLPTTHASVQPGHGGKQDAFVGKLSPDGSRLVYLSYIGGGNDDYGRAMAVDREDSVYLTGSTRSHDFPVTTGTFNPKAPVEGTRDAFICKFPGWHLDPPEAVAGPDQVVDQHEEVVFNGTASRDDLGINEWTWSFVVDGRDVLLIGPTSNYTFDEAATYTVVLNVTDGHGNWDLDSLTITVRDITPPEIVVESDVAIDQHESIMLNASNSTDNVGIANWMWDIEYEEVHRVFNGSNMTFTFDVAGSYTVHLRVTDAAGNSATASIPITVKDTTPPTVDAGPDVRVLQGEIVHFDEGLWTDNVGVVNWTWEFEYDGEPVVLGIHRSSFLFDLAGIYEVALTVSDAADNRASDTMTVTVLDTTDPVADAGRDKTVNQHQVVGFDGSGSSDNVGVTNLTWSFYYNGSSMTFHGRPATFEFDLAGTYTVWLRVRDVAGNMAYDECILTVRDITQPTADANRDWTIHQGERIILDGYNSIDNVGIVAWEWSFEYGGEIVILLGEVQDFVFEIPGNFTITLTVRDAAGNEADDTMLVNVIQSSDLDSGTPVDPNVIIALMAIAFILLFSLIVTLRRRS